MTQQKLLKRLRHQKQQIANQERLLQHHNEHMKQHETDLVPIIPIAQKNSTRDLVGIASMFTMEQLFNMERTKSESRFILQEFQGETDLGFTGFVDDIRKIVDRHNRTHYTLLLQYPVIYGSLLHPVERKIDSHMWISLDDIDSTTNATISYGDFLLFKGEISSYHGHVEGGYRGWKNGVNHIRIIKSGYLPRSPKYDGMLYEDLIIDDYIRPHVLVKIVDGKIKYAHMLPKWAHEQHMRRKTHEPLTDKIMADEYGLKITNNNVERLHKPHI